MLASFHITQNEGKFFFPVLARCKTLKEKKKKKFILQNCTFLHFFFFTLIFLSDWKKINNKSVCY